MAIFSFFLSFYLVGVLMALCEDYQWHGSWEMGPLFFFFGIAWSSGADKEIIM